MRTFFQFAFGRSDGSTKFIVVEAETVEQMECVKEAVGRGIERCTLLAVFHQCFAVTLVNGAFTSVGFAEFMMDMAGYEDMPKKLQGRIERAAVVEADEEVPAVRALPAAAAPAEPQAEKLTSALCGLGFGAPSVKKWVKSLGERAEVDSLPNLVKDGVKALVSTNTN